MIQPILLFRAAWVSISLISFKVVLMMSLSFLFSGCAGTPVPRGIGLGKGGDAVPRPAPVPSSPNCVSSYVTPGEDSEHGILPFDRKGLSPGEALSVIKMILAEEPRVEILSEIPGYLHAVQYSAFWKFPDDVEFWFPENENLIHFRSSSRLGYSDLGVNRKRMERIRTAFEAKSPQGAPPSQGERQ